MAAAAEFGGAFGHSGEPDTGRVRGGDADAVVGDLYEQHRSGLALYVEPEQAVPGVGVAGRRW